MSVVVRGLVIQIIVTFRGRCSVIVLSGQGTVAAGVILLRDDRGIIGCIVVFRGCSHSVVIVIVVSLIGRDLCQNMRHGVCKGCNRQDSDQKNREQKLFGSC